MITSLLRRIPIGRYTKPRIEKIPPPARISSQFTSRSAATYQQTSNIGVVPVVKTATTVHANLGGPNVRSADTSALAEAQELRTEALLERSRMVCMTDHTSSTCVQCNFVLSCSPF